MRIPHTKIAGSQLLIKTRQCLLCRCELFESKCRCTMNASSACILWLNLKFQSEFSWFIYEPKALCTIGFLCTRAGSRTKDVFLFVLLLPNLELLLLSMTCLWLYQASHFTLIRSITYITRSANYRWHFKLLQILCEPQEGGLSSQGFFVPLRKWL